MMILEPFRWIIGQGVLGYEKLTRAKPVEREMDQQAAIDAQTSSMALYEFRSCPFCMKVRKVIHAKNLKIEKRDARRNKAWGRELKKEGGKWQVPCLKITESDGGVTWLYESSDIINYLNEHFPD
jgi:glutaredoxin